MRAKAPLASRESIVRVGQRRQVVIPREMFESLNLREGDFVAFSKHRNGVLIKPKQVVHPGEVLTPAEAKKVRHGLKQIREGKTQPWSQIKHELGL